MHDKKGSLWENKAWGCGVVQECRGRVVAKAVVERVEEFEIKSDAERKGIIERLGDMLGASDAWDELEKYTKRKRYCIAI